MISYGITIEKLISTIENNNLNDGAGRLTQGVESILVRSVGQVKDLHDIEKLLLP